MKLNNVNGCNDVSYVWCSLCSGRRPHSPFGELWTGVGTGMSFPCCPLSQLRCACQSLASILCPCTSCFNGKRVEDVGFAQPGVLVILVLCRLLGCCTWLGGCVVNMRLCICVWYCHIPRHGFPFGPGQKSGSTRSFVVIPRQADWFFNCWHLGSLDRSPFMMSFKWL